MPHPTDSATRPALQGLILDFAGVLTADPRPVHREWCSAQGLDPEAWRSTLNDHPEGRRLYEALEVGEIGQAEWNARTAPLLGSGADPTNLMGRAWSGVPTARRMAALVQAARDAGLRTALLSNSFGMDPHNPYEHAGIWGLFDVHVISEQVGMAKPNPAIYELTLERLGLPGEACVFADDHPVNLPPAAALGITTLLVADEEAAVSKLESILGINVPLTV
ncbi:HAD-IA family hydrolase [Streptomyces erythrochromogenes]|uniref:HAD-IA family hydrolase n=1 Tax=Streptomyces erythrochromogenes TaxID=285574 RepID=UPI00369CCC64